MRKYFVALSVLMVLSLSSIAGASSMDKLNWWTYDSFPGPSLDASLWQPPGGNYVGYTVNSGLTVIVSSDQPKFSLDPTYSISTGDFFAEKFSFNVSGSVQSGGGVGVSTDIGAPSVPDSAIPISWAWANNYQGLNGKLFASGPDDNPIYVFTDVTHGQLGFIYNGTSISMYYNDGSGWQMLYSVNPNWSGPLSSKILGVHINGAEGSSITATFTDVQFATSFATPDIHLSSESLDFGNLLIGAISDQTITVQNGGAGILDIGSIASPSSPFTMTTDNCSNKSLTSGATCTIGIRFSPTFSDEYSSNFSIPSNDSDGSKEVSLSGRGVQFLINPQEGTLGTEVTVAGTGFGGSKGKIVIGNIALKVATWADTEIKASLGKAMAPGSYGVSVRPKTKGSKPISESKFFEVKGPEIGSMEPPSGKALQTVTIKGKFFGSKKGKVYLNGKSCKVTTWTMNPGGEFDEIVFVVPKGTAPGTYPLKITNSVGEDTGEFMVLPQQLENDEISVFDGHLYLSSCYL